MDSVRFHARLLALYFAQYAKARLAYRADFLTAVFTSFAGTAASLAVVHRGRLHDGRGPLAYTSRILGPDFSLTLEPLKGEG